MKDLNECSIVLIIPDFDFGGEEKRVVFFANNYLNFFKEVYVISPGGKSNLLLDPRVKHLEVKVRGYRNIIKILIFLRAKKVDFVQGHKRATLPYLLLSERLCRIYSLFNFDNIYLKGNRFNKLLSPRNIVYLSDILKNFYLPYYSNSNNTTINMGGDFYEVDTTDVILKTKTSLNITDEFVLLSLGRLSKQKNHKLLIQSLRRCSDIHYICLIVGIGPDVEELKQYVVDYGLVEKVRFLGHRTDISSLVNVADVLIQSSIFEGFPNVLIEAASVGLPLIATNVGSSSTLIEDNGILIQTENENELTAAIHKMYTDYPKFKTAACSFMNSEFFKQFHKDTMLVNYIEYYKAHLQ